MKQSLCTRFQTRIPFCDDDQRHRIRQTVSLDPNKRKQRPLRLVSHSEEFDATLTCRCLADTWRRHHRCRKIARSSRGNTDEQSRITRRLVKVQFCPAHSYALFDLA